MFGVKFTYKIPPPQFDDLTQKQIYCCGTCQTKQHEQATGLRTQENDSETETYSPKNHWWFDSNTVEGQNATYTRWEIFTMAPQKVICAILRGRPWSHKLWWIIPVTYHMGYMDKGDRMANSYSICHQTMKWTEKLFYDLLDLAILKSCIYYYYLGGGGLWKLHIKIFDSSLWGICWHRLI
jgi:hypothetical protein